MNECLLGFKWSSYFEQQSIIRTKLQCFSSVICTFTSLQAHRRQSRRPTPNTTSEIRGIFRVLVRAWCRMKMIGSNVIFFPHYERPDAGRDAPPDKKRNQ